MLASVHVHVFHHSLDAFGIVVAALVVAAFVVAIGLIASKVVANSHHPDETEPMS